MIGLKLEDDTFEEREWDEDETVATDAHLNGADLVDLLGMQPTTHALRHLTF